MNTMKLTMLVAITATAAAMSLDRPRHPPTCAACTDGQVGVTCMTGGLGHRECCFFSLGAGARCSLTGRVDWCWGPLREAEKVEGRRNQYPSIE